MNITKRLIEALQMAGYKVRYTEKLWGRGYKYEITGIGRANYKYAQNALKKAESLVSAKRKYTTSEKTRLQRAAARAAKAKISKLTAAEQELYREMKKLWKKKANREAYKKLHPGATKSASIDTIMKLPPASRLPALQKRVNELKGLVNNYEIDNLASILARAGRMTGVDVYDVVAKLRSGDYKMTQEQFKEFRDILIDSNNPDFWEKQMDPEQTIKDVVNKLNAFFNK